MTKLKPQPVELDEIAGDDFKVARAAWFSTSKEAKARIAEVPGLLQRLAKGDPPENKPHTVPWEHTMITFVVVSDIATHIHFLKHRVGVSVSSQSARYAEFKEDNYYIPEDWPQPLQELAATKIEAAFEMYHDLILDLQNAGLSRKRAKESARFVLPYATQIRYMVTFNFRSFVHFLSLRNTDHAQREIQAIADEMLRLVRETGKFEHSLKAWGI